MIEIDRLRDEIVSDIGAASDLGALDAVRVKALGKKGLITEQLKQLGRMAPEERKAAARR